MSRIRAGWVATPATKTIHRLDDVRMTVWRIKNVEIPHWKRTRVR